MALIDQLIELMQERRDRGTRFVAMSAENRAFLAEVRTPQAPAATAAQTAGIPATNRPRPPEKREVKSYKGTRSSVTPTRNMPAPEPTLKPRTVPIVPAIDHRQLTAIPTLEELGAILAEDASCPSCRKMKERALGRGPADADLVIVGGRPGLEDVGAAGEMLSKIIGAMEVSPDRVYFTTATKCRPRMLDLSVPESIPPCAAYLRREIALIKPKAALLLGGVPLHIVCEKSIHDVRGQWLDFEGIPVLATHPPSILTLKPELKRAAWGDIQNVMARLA
ncbi:MAG: uracil-DNA glycosylase family 4 [Rhodothermales bacterium]|jgi:uracil-DNA glycosylase family 4